VVRQASELDLRIQQNMETALEMLDEGGYPADIGAHLDMAICRLREHLGLPPMSIQVENDAGPPSRLAV
jgi:hypothetical protein